MRKEVRSEKRSSQVGPRIIRAWFDTVINPLLRALKTEQVYLNEKNWTWRFRPSGLELIRPVRAHIASFAWDNLEQFLDMYPEVKQSVQLHDKKVSLLLERCQQLHRVIEGSPALRKVYRRVTSPESLSKLGTTLTDIFGAYPESDHLAVLAQYMVNNKGDLPVHYTTARLWNEYKDEFLAVLDRQYIRRRHETTIKAGEALLQRVNRLSHLLERTRLRLSLEHDVPYVVARSSEEEVW